jgi:glycosyltransferase involved in cell wall biosynthesis
MRILYIINRVGCGGAEKQLHDRAVELARRGHSVGVISMAPFLDLERSLNVSRVETFTLGLEARSGLPAALKAYAGIVRRFAPDVIHSHLFWSSLLARTARLLPAAMRGGRRPVLVCSSHSQSEPSRARFVAYRLTDRLGDAWVSVSREGIAVHEAAGAIRRGAARWMPNGVELGRFQPNAAIRQAVRSELDVGAQFVWLALGSFHAEHKDYSTMLRAFARVPDSGSLLLIGGEGALLGEKRELAASLGLDARVRFLGPRSDAERLLQAADAYVMSSQTEGMPNVLLQAAASGLPIVTTDVGEASAIVEDARGGFVVPPRDPARLAGAMSRLEAMDADARRGLGETGRAHVAEHFDFARVVDRWEDLYRDVYARKGRSVA